MFVPFPSLSLAALRRYFFFAAIGRAGPLRVRAFVCVR
jgi:hypothetical protein